MKIYDTEKEARDAAEALRGTLIVKTIVDEHEDLIYVRLTSNANTLAVFRFKPERVAPAKEQAVIEDDSGQVYYSAGELSQCTGGGLRVSHEPDCSGFDCVIDSSTPVEIIPAGQFAKAVELLKRMVAPDDGSSNAPFLRSVSDAKALLDEIKSGGE
jgi:hypothetical protein